MHIDTAARKLDSFKNAIAWEFECMCPVPESSIEAIEELVAGFREHLLALRDAQTSEAVIRQEYIDRFWSALGWDVGNRAQRSHAEKDVLIEAPFGARQGQRTANKRPDYLFRIDGFPRFIVEAKRPATDLADDQESIFQAKSYAWSAQIPFAALTNFDAFRLYDATLKPYLSDPQRGLVRDFDLRFEDYLTQWDILWDTFGRDAVASGSLERLLARIKRVRAGRRIRGVDRMLFDLRGTEPVDQDFLNHLESYRLRFARDLYQENRASFVDADTLHGAARLTEATQRLLDRLVFMRVCEDRGIISDNTLRDSLNEASENSLDLYATITGQFRHFDAQYNGYLFKAHFSENLQLSPELLADFIRSLYRPENSYRFDAIGDDLLGIIYERFLGHTITVAMGQVDATEKPEVQHAGGVYYTPKFVVDTIVRRVVGDKVKGKSPIEVLGVKVLDPACGSGSFLINAFQFLIDYCLNYISTNPDAAVVPRSPRARTQTRRIAFQDAENDWHLAPDFKAELLVSCIHGVDIDAQAVEVTIMSLYLKMLEGKLPADWQREFLDRRLLPPLDNNIRCGNSLLSSADFDAYWDSVHGTLFEGDDDVRFRINAFDWDSGTHGFGRVLEGHKFDCIIGNPPYIRVQELAGWQPEECAFYRWKYRSAARGNYDIYVVFLEHMLDLLSGDGIAGFICPHKFWQAQYGIGIRGILADGRHLRSIVDFTDQQVFRKATTYTAIHILSKAPNDGAIDFARITELVDGDSQCRSIDSNSSGHGFSRFAAAHPVSSQQWFFNPPDVEQTLAAIEARGVPLFPEVCEQVFQGIITGADDIFLSPQFVQDPTTADLVLFQSTAAGSAIPIEKELVCPVLRRQGFEAFATSGEYGLLLPYNRRNASLLSESRMTSEFPHAWRYLNGFKERLQAREDGRFRDTWWCLSRAQNIERWCSSKILIPYMISKLEAAWDDTASFFVNVTTGGYGLQLRRVDDREWALYLVGLLNSRLLDFYLRCKSSHFHSGYFPANKQFIDRLPILVPSSEAELRDASEISERVSQVIAIKTRLRSSLNASDRERSRGERDIEAHHARIDAIVGQLYGVRLGDTATEAQS